MKYKYIIVAPQYGEKGKYYEFPLGLAYLSSCLKLEGHDVQCINLNHGSAFPDFNSHNCVLVGGLSVHYKQVKDIIKQYRAMCPDAVIVAGGGMVTADIDTMAANLGADYLCRGEGEIAMVNMARSLSRGERPANKDISVDDDKLNVNLLPLPDYEGMGIKDYLLKQNPDDCYYLQSQRFPRAFPIIGSRGCPYHCTFCFSPMGKKYRQRSLTSLFQEIDVLVTKYKVNILAIIDEVFAVDKDRLMEFTRRITPYNVKYIVQLRCDTVDREMLHALAISGCSHISYGIESMSQPVLDSMKKGINKEQIHQALEMTYDEGIGIQGNLIFGDVAETVDTARESLEWWIANKKFGVNLTTIIPYPGCELYKLGVASGKIKPLEYIEKGCPSVNLSGLPDTEYGRIFDLREEYRNRR